MLLKIRFLSANVTMIILTSRGFLSIIESLSLATEEWGPFPAWIVPVELYSHFFCTMQFL